MGRISVVAIHGVGLPTPGSILKDVQNGLSHVANYGYRSDVLVDGITYPRVKFEHGPISEIIEVNWSDIKRASQSATGALRHLVLVVMAMLYLANANLHNSQKSVRLAWWYKFFFEAVLVWCIYPAIYMLLYLSMNSSSKRCISIIILTVALGLITTYLGRFSRYFYAGYLWIIFSVLLVGFQVLTLLSQELVLLLSTYAYVMGQGVTVLALLLCAIEVMLRSWKNLPAEYITSRLAFLYIPLLCMSALGAMIWAGSLLIASKYGGNAEGYGVWEAAYLKNLNYNLASMEYAFAVVVFSIGLLCMAGTAKYLYVRHIKKSIQSPSTGFNIYSGTVAQDWIFTLGRIAPVSLSLLAVFYLLSLAFLESDPSTDVLSVYSWSAMRALPFIPLVIGPLAILLDVFGDVIFYLLPIDNKISALVRTRERLENGINIARMNDHDIVVLSHSQGTVVAIDVVGAQDNSDIRLITAGSPIASLYSRFLLSTPKGRERSYRTPKRWKNIFRLDDYVAGPISTEKSIELESTVDVRGGHGGHIGYWDDIAVANLILNAEVEQNDEAVT